MTRRVVVIGAGNAGISLAARLRRRTDLDVTICDARAFHRYRPLLSYVGAGLATRDEVERPTSDVVPDGCRLVPEDVVDVDVERRVVRTTGDVEVPYDDLVVATGLVEDLGATPGLAHAYGSGWAVSTFVDRTAEAVWERARDMTSGTAVFTVPPEPAPCSVTAMKPLFMLADHWRRRGILPRLEVHLVLPGADCLPLGGARPNTALDDQLDRLGVRVHRATDVVRVDADRRCVTIREDGVEKVLLDVLLPHVVPRYRAPLWIETAGLDGARAGLVDVDPETLHHRRRDDVWALGDVADVDTPPSGGALRKQVDVLAHNLVQRSDARFRRYDGYTVMPVTTDRHRLVLVEVDRHGRPRPTSPVPDLTRPRRSTFRFDRHVLPQLYFRRILRGKV